MSNTVSAAEPLTHMADNCLFECLNRRVSESGLYHCVQKTKNKKAWGQIPAAVAHLSPLPLVMLTSFSMPPVSARALAFSMFLLVTSCRVQQMAATVSSDSRVVFPPGRRLTRSLIAYFPEREEGEWDLQLVHFDILWTGHVGRGLRTERRGGGRHTYTAVF